MNDKEKELWRVIDNVIKCCAIELPNGELSITREDVLGKSRAENLVMTRCMVVEQMIHAGFSITTTATVLNRTVPAVRQPMRDVTIEVEGKQTIYTIPEHLGVTFAGETVLATDKADLLPEVGKLVNEADEIIKAYEPSKERKAKGEELLAALNPAIKEKQETEKRFKALEGDISGIRGMVKQLLDKLG
jgi:hypothetical protein